MVLERRHRVGHRAQADALDVAGVIARAAVVIVLAAGDAVVDQQREQRGRHVAGIEPLDEVVAPHLDVDQVGELGAVGGQQLVKGRKRARIARFQPDPLPGARIDAVVQGQLEHLGHVQVAGQVVIFLAKGADLDAAAGAAGPRVGHRLALAHQLLHRGVGVEHRGLAEPGADDARRALDKRVGALFTDLDRGAWLQEAHLFDHVQDQVGHLVDPVRAVLPHPAGVDLGKIGIGAALGGGDAHLGRGGLVVELDPETVQQLFRRLAGQRALRQSLLVKGQQVLVEPAGVKGVPGVELGGHAQVNEPIVL